jgi:hypothetical protein
MSSRLEPNPPEAVASKLVQDCKNKEDDNGEP